MPNEFLIAPLRRFIHSLVVGLLIVSNAFSVDVFYSGVCFVGNASDFGILFPYSKSIDDAGENALDKFVSTRILEKASKLENINLKLADLADLSGSSAYVLAFAIDGESVSISESILQGKSLFDVKTQLSAQLLVFDYKTKNIVFNFPVVTQFTSISDGEPPSKELISDMFQTMLLDESSKVNILNRLMKKLKKVKLNNDQIYRIGVSDIIFSEKSLNRFPKALKESPDILKRQLGQSLVASLSKNCKINVLPYIGNTAALSQESDQISNTNSAIGGKMLTRFSNGDIFELKVPEADYTINIKLRGFGYQLGSSTRVQQMVNYASFVNMTLSEPFSNEEYMNQNFMNIFVDSTVKGSPSLESREWFCFSTATAVLLDGITKQLLKPNKEWCKKYGGEKAFKQITSANKIINKCKL